MSLLKEHSNNPENNMTNPDPATTKPFESEDHTGRTTTARTLDDGEDEERRVVEKSVVMTTTTEKHDDQGEGEGSSSLDTAGTVDSSASDSQDKTQPFRQLDTPSSANLVDKIEKLRLNKNNSGEIPQPAGNEEQEEEAEVVAHCGEQIDAVGRGCYESDGGGATTERFDDTISIRESAVTSAKGDSSNDTSRNAKDVAVLVLAKEKPCQGEQPPAALGTTPTFDSDEPLAQEHHRHHHHHVLVTAVPRTPPHNVSTSHVGKGGRADESKPEQVEKSDDKVQPSVKNLLQVYEKKTTPARILEIQTGGAKCPISPNKCGITTSEEISYDEKNSAVASPTSNVRAIFAGPAAGAGGDDSVSELSGPQMMPEIGVGIGIEEFYKYQKLQKAAERQKVKETWRKYHGDSKEGLQEAEQAADPLGIAACSHTEAGSKEEGRQEMGHPTNPCDISASSPPAYGMDDSVSGKSGPRPSAVALKIGVAIGVEEFHKHQKLQKTAERQKLKETWSEYHSDSKEGLIEVAQASNSLAISTSGHVAARSNEIEPLEMGQQTNPIGISTSNPAASGGNEESHQEAEQPRNTYDVSSSNPASVGGDVSIPERSGPPQINATSPEFGVGLGVEEFHKQQKLKKLAERQKVKETWLKYHCDYKQGQEVEQLLVQPSAQARAYAAPSAASTDAATGQVLVDYKNRDYRAFVFLIHHDFGLLLLHCTRKKNKPDHWQLPGGHVDEFEFAQAATQSSDRTTQLVLASKAGAARELFEETGLDIRKALQRLEPARVRSSGGQDHNEDYPINELKNRLFFFLQVTDDDFPKEGLAPQCEVGKHLRLKISKEHSGFTFEPVPNKAAEMLHHHSGGKCSEALLLALSMDNEKMVFLHGGSVESVEPMEEDTATNALLQIQDDLDVIPKRSKLSFLCCFGL